MLEKTIKSVITKKLTAWLDTIEDPGVRKIASENVVVTGGCFPSLMTNQKPKDYDVYFKTMDATLAVAKYYVSQFNDDHGSITTKISTITKAAIVTGEMFTINNDGKIVIHDSELKSILGRDEFFANAPDDEATDENFVGMSRMICNTPKDRIKIFVSSDGVAGQIAGNNLEDLEMGGDPVDIISQADDIPADDLESQGDERKPYRPVFLSTNAITLADGIQIIVRFYGSPDDIHETYDFVHTKAYYTSNDGVVIPREVYEAVMNKTLIYTGSKYPICSVIRIRKFIARGWTINAGQVLKMAMQISDLDLHSIDTLEDQLVGVDSLYFAQLIRQFRKQKENDANWTLDTGYVISIIDKIF